jgi:hypothetical protein
MQFFLAEVRNVKDPDNQGKVQVRIYGYNDDEQTNKDENLHWALPIMPVTSASTGGVGTLPHGVIKGSRVLGMFIDETQKHAIILGSYYRSHKPTDKNDNTGGQEQLDKTSKGVDLPKPGNVTTKQDPDNIPDNRGKNPFLTRADGKPLNTDDDKYNEATFTDNGFGQAAINTIRKMFAPNADQPTIAGAPPGLDLPSALKAVDPSGAAQTLVQFFAQMALVAAMMNMTNKSGSSSGVKSTVTDAFTGALSRLAAKYGFEIIINIFTKCLGNGGINQIDVQYQDIVRRGLAKLIENVAQYGVNNLPLSETPTLIYHTDKDPVPLPVVGDPPNLYVQQYYQVGQDPWVGFIEWKGPNGDYVYTVRSATDHPYPSNQDAIYSDAENELVKALDPYIRKGSITPFELNKILEACMTSTYNNGLEKNLGKGSSTSLAALIGLIGLIGTAINLVQTLQLPKSVLNAGSVTRTLTNFARNIAILKSMKNMSGGAFGLPGVGQLGMIANLAGLATGNISSLVGNIAGNLLGDAVNSFVGGEAANIVSNITSAVTSGVISGAVVKNMGGNNTMVKAVVLSKIISEI